MKDYEEIKQEFGESGYNHNTVFAPIVKKEPSEAISSTVTETQTKQIMIVELSSSESDDDSIILLSTEDLSSKTDDFSTFFQISRLFFLFRRFHVSLYESVSDRPLVLQSVLPSMVRLAFFFLTPNPCQNG